ncbi:hypothetical protein D3C78_1626590 [compost metagenome]
MTCLICSGAAETYDSGGDWHERNCARCGRYRVSRTLVDTMAGRKQSFDVVRTRAWIATNKVTTPSPLISSSEADQHQLIFS